MTSKAALIPPLNRNFNHVVDHNGSGLIAYASKGCIYVLDFKTTLPTIVDSKVIRNGHRGKVCCVSFCKSSGSEFLATVGECMMIKIWDLNAASASCIASLEVKEYTRLVEWLYDTTNTIVFNDGLGSVCKWNFKKSNQVIKMKTASDRSISFLSSNPKCPELLAVGNSVGIISILNVNNQTFLKSLRAHSMEITSLSWSPILPSTLLSTSLDQSARIWKLDEDKPLHTYYYPTARYKDKSDEKKNLKICGMFHPENPNVIICSNIRNAVGSVLFCENGPPKFTPYSFPDSESNFKGVFQMLPYVDVTGENKHIFLTLEPLRISLWNISDEKMLSSFPCVNGIIYDISVSQINPDVMAVGSGDGFLKILTLEPEEKVVTTTVYINIRMKIMCVAWHPTLENIIAYGTDEGRVGIADIKKKRSLCSFETHHTNSVYSLQWAPCCKINESKEYFLYSCGGGTILVHEFNKPKSKAEEFETFVTLPPDLEVDHKSYSELCWKSDYTCLAVGSFNGSVYLYNEKFNFLCRFVLQIKNLEKLKWHPMHTYSSHIKESKYSSWLAAVGNDENIHVFDTSDALTGKSEATIFTATKTLVGHKKKVGALCWSVHTEGHLISGSRDGVLQVWNVITATPIVNYMWHRDLIYAVQWSAVNPDIIYSGGSEFCLRTWKISEQNQSEIPAKSLVSKHKPFKGAKYKSLLDEKEACKSPTFFKKTEAIESKTNIASSGVSVVPPVTDSTRVIPSRTRPDYMREKDAQGFFSLKNYSKEEGFQNVLKLVDLTCDKNSKTVDNQEDLLALGLFSDQFVALKMLEAKEKIDRNIGNKDKATCLQVVTGNAAELITDAAEKKELTDFLVAISPSVSYAFWLSICEKYAIQLIEEHQHRKSSIYFMLCGKLHDGIKMLMEKGKLTDALALAKARLPENDPIIKTLLVKLTILFRNHKFVESEVQCLIALNDPLNAAKLMCCTGDAKYTYGSVYICHKFNLPEAAQEYAMICTERCLSQNDWPTFHKVAEIVESVKVYKVVVRVHEIIFSNTKALKKEDGVIGNEIFGTTGSKIPIWEGKRPENSDLSFLAYIYDIIKSEGILPEDKKVLEGISQALNSLETIKKAESEAHISVSLYISQVIISSLLGNMSDAIKYFTKIFPCTYNVVFIPKIICWIFFPLDIYWCCNKNKFLCEVKKMNIDILPSLTHFQDIFNLVCDKINCIGDSNTEISLISDIIPNLDETVQKVVPSLCSKKIEDCFCLYFSSSYLNELRRLAKRGWKFRCYDNGNVFNVTLERLTYIYDNETDKWLVNTDGDNAEGSISINDVLKQVELNNFQLAEEYESKDGSQNISSIIDVVFTPETDSSSKDEFVQICGFKDTSDFLQKVMPNPKSVIDLKSDVPDVNLSSGENGTNQVKDCQTNLLPSEDEDFHAQCWTDVSLFYVLTKVFFSVICKDEYTLLYYLQKYLQNLDLQIANYARMQTAKCSQNSGISKGNLPLNQKVKDHGTKNTEDVVNISEDDISKSMSEDSELTTKFYSLSIDNNNILINKNGCKLESEINENERAEVEKKVNIVNKNLSKEDSAGIPLETASDHENITNVKEKYQSEFNGVIALNSTTSSDNVITLNPENGEGDLEVINEDNTVIEDLNFVNYEDANCDPDEVCDTLTDKDEHDNSKDNLDKLQILHEKISEQIKLLQIEGFWYPDPFVSISDIKGICCDIFHKHPCVLVKQKFHELAHEVHQWYSKYTFTEEPNTCEICKKLMPNM